jgi:hypothetical protein
LIPPAYAFSSLNGCVSNPECATLLGLEAAYAAPAFVAPSVVAAPVGAAAAGATAAAPNLLFPAVSGAAGVAAGTAFFRLPWGDERAAEFYNSGVTPQLGGQSAGVQYYYDYTTNSDSLSQRYPDNLVVGPVSAPYVQWTGPSGLSPPRHENYRIVSDTGDGPFYHNILGATQRPGDPTNPPDPAVVITDRTFRRVDGAPDFGGSPSSNPDPGRIIDFAPSPDAVPYPVLRPTSPNPRFGPSTYRPATPQPYIWVNPATGLPEWRIGPFTLPAPDIGPDGGANPPPQLGDPDYELTPNDPGYDPPLIPPGLPPGGCDGWGYGGCQLSTQFPFDFMGSLPSLPPRPPCPSYTFFGQSMEFCFLIDILDAAKWVVWLGFSVSMVISL